MNFGMRFAVVHRWSFSFGIPILTGRRSHSVQFEDGGAIYRGSMVLDRSQIREFSMHFSTCKAGLRLRSKGC